MIKMEESNNSQQMLDEKEVTNSQQSQEDDVDELSNGQSQGELSQEEKKNHVMNLINTAIF